MTKILAREKDLGGFTVKRLLPFNTKKMVGPWIFFDHMGPATFNPGEGINVRPHPHVNLATVTYLFEGEIYHRDSLGSSQAIVPGEINLMVAGKGIVHSERERDEIKQSHHKVHGLQLWHALPTEFEEIDPAFYHYEKDQIPSKDKDGTLIRVMIGKYNELESPVKTFTQTLFMELMLDEGKKIDTPEILESALYVISGEILVDGCKLNGGEMLILKESAKSIIESLTTTHLIIIGGKPVGKRYIDWNFVSSRKARIEQAKNDWKAQDFAKVPGDSEEFIPLPKYN